ncbi:hypothetical protein C8J56DRAFT_900175 [Mycena floridula]|nr:hypothetical protein C8J56DRAFT_900175 [Mycena floridula]
MSDQWFLVELPLILSNCVLPATTSSNYSPPFRGCFLFVPVNHKFACGDTGTQFHLIHDTAENGLDIVPIAAFEGIVLLWFDENESKWERHLVGTGLPPDQVTPYRGAGSLDVARIGDDSIGYIAICVANISRTPKESRGPNLLNKMFEVDSFGPLDDKTHTGTIQSVYTVKIGGREYEALAIRATLHLNADQPCTWILCKTEIMDLDQSAGQLAVAAFAEKSFDRLASFEAHNPSLSKKGYLDERYTQYHVSMNLAISIGNSVFMLRPNPPRGPHRGFPACRLATHLLDCLVQAGFSSNSGILPRLQLPSSARSTTLQTQTCKQYSRDLKGDLTIDFNRFSVPSQLLDYESHLWESFVGCERDLGNHHQNPERGNIM